MKHIFFRPAIAMIELIFSIVIMGIVLMSAPMLITTASTSSQAAFQQESIAMIASHTNALLTYAWDEQDTDSANNYSILDTNSPTAILNFPSRSLISSRSLGKKRFLPPGGAAGDASNAASFGQADNGETEADDIDDFSGETTALSSITAVSEIIDGEYLDRNISINTQVVYANAEASSADFSTCQNSGDGCAYSQPFTTKGVSALAGTRNIKLITTELTSDNVDTKDIIFKAFMCNIGTALPSKREGI